MVTVHTPVEQHLNFDSSAGAAAASFLFALGSCHAGKDAVISQPFSQCENTTLFKTGLGALVAAHVDSL
jgi:hypothetical protein